LFSVLAEAYRGIVLPQTGITIRLTYLHLKRKEGRAMNNEQVLAKRDEYYARAKEVRTLEDFDALFHDLTENETHDYSTICYAVVAMAVAATKAIDRSKVGGITGFQASCCMWDFMEQFNGITPPSKLLQYNDMLYPQLLYKFDKVVSTETWEWVKEKAYQNILQYPNSHPDVLKHWQSILRGELPEGFIVADD
jgi:hypothetical protein